MYIVVDTETTGLKSENARVIEVAAVVLDEKLHEVDAWSSLANPGEKAFVLSDPISLEINGITHDEVSSAPSDAEVAKNLHGFISKFWGATLTAYNVEFDSWFLSREPWRISVRYWGECIMLTAMKIMKRQNLPNLKEAAAFFEVPFEKAHRALEDARTAARIYTEILRRRQKEEADQETGYMLDSGL